MVGRFDFGDISVGVVWKDIKNIHLSVYPPDGTVRVAAPLAMNPETVRVYVISKLGWIKKQRQKFQEQERETPREYLQRESHYLWGKRYLLQIVEAEKALRVTVEHSTLLLSLRPGAAENKKSEIFAEWYRRELKMKAGSLIAHWQATIGVTVARVFVQKMKTRWGSCNYQRQSIRLNTELAKKPVECLEYIVVHEMVHLLEPSHNKRFVAFMDHFLPNWLHYRQELNRYPVRHEKWEY